MWLEKIFKKRKLKPSLELKVAIINDDSDDLYETFGIIEERKQELIKLCDYSLLLKKSSDSYVYIVENCKHINEIIICCIILDTMRAQYY
tara:strand:- start:921 stop:1190 length:270 start_codon:yes stop_codon:yes gene_type:complete